jgi:hypothetical protein
MQKFNHEAKTMHEAVGIERDLLEEIEFKAKQLVDNYDTKSETLERGLAWVSDRFQSNQAVISALLFSAIGTATAEKRVSTMLEMLKSKNLPQKIAVDSEEKLGQVQEEINALVTEFGGEIQHSEEGAIIAVGFENDERKKEFNARLESIRLKYSEPDDLGSFGSFGSFGPLAEA